MKTQKKGAKITKEKAHPQQDPARVLPKGGRAQEVVLAAYALIAEKGMEGLRTRDVAERVGINPATLHYYFPTKEALIQGVVEHLMRELMTNRGNSGKPKTALDLLKAEFTDIRTRIKDSPDQLIVLTELAVRAWRDPTVAQMLRYLDEGWCTHLMSIFKTGVDQGVFRSDLDIRGTAHLMMSQLRGLGFQGKFDADRLDELLANLTLQTQHWIMARIEPKAHKSR